MTLPEEELPDVAAAARAVVQEATDGGVWVFGGGLHSHEEVSVLATDGMVTDGPPREKGVHRRILGPRRALTRGGAGEGCQDRRRLPLSSRGPRVPARPSGGTDRGPNGQFMPAAPEENNRLRQRAGMSPDGEAASGPDGTLGSVSAVPVARSATGAVASKS
jgi:hypothetical protein